MQQRHSLTLKQAKYLLAVVTLAIVFKIITAKDITYSDDKIQNIDGVKISQGKITITRNIYNVDTSPIVMVDQRETLSDNWEKYLKQLRKSEL